MHKDPKQLDKRVFVVMALFIGLFSYFTLSPDSHFRKIRNLDPHHDNPAFVSGELQLTASTRNGMIAQLPDVGQSRIRLISEPVDFEPGAIWQVEGMLDWGSQGLVLTVSEINQD